MMAGYTKLEYIESTGSQYIDTLLKLSNKAQVIMEFELKDISAVNALFGSRSSSSSCKDKFCVFALAGGKIRSDHYNNYKSSTSALSVNTKYVLNRNSHICTINNETLTGTDSTITSKYNCYLFSVNTANDRNHYSKMKLYYCKIYDNGKLLLDLIPAKSFSGEIGLYDNISDGFYTSMSTDAFVAGAEIVEPKFINKVIFDGKTLIDLTSLTVTPETLVAGATAKDCSGNDIVGTAPQIITSTTNIEDGSSSSYPEGSLYIVYEEV